VLYTVNAGPINRLRQAWLRTGGIGLPLLALGFLLLAAFSFTTSGSAGKNPYIATHKNLNTAKQTSAKPATANPSGPSPTSSPSSQNQIAGVQNPVATIQSNTNLVPITGGLGGGDSTPLTNTPPPATLTVACTDLLSVSQICTACTPPLTLQPGQKALLSSDGTCAAVN